MTSNRDSTFHSLTWAFVHHHYRTGNPLFPALSRDTVRFSRVFPQTVHRHLNAHSINVHIQQPVGLDSHHDHQQHFNQQLRRAPNTQTTLLQPHNHSSTRSSTLTTKHNQWSPIANGQSLPSTKINFQRGGVTKGLGGVGETKLVALGGAGRSPWAFENRAGTAASGVGVPFVMFFRVIPVLECTRWWITPHFCSDSARSIISERRNLWE